MANYDASFNGSWPNESFIRLYVNWSNSVENNTSDVSFSLESHVFNTGSYAEDSPTWYIAVNDSVIKSGYYNFSRGGHEVVLGTASGTYAHNDDGSLTIKVSGYFGGAGSGSALGTAYVEANVDLGTIARASSIDSCGNVTLGNACSITWTPKSSDFKYMIHLSLGGWSAQLGYIQPSSTSKYTYTNYTIPISGVANQLPNATSGTMVVTLTTYNSSGTQIGSAATSKFTVTIPSSVIPTISSCSVSRVTGLNSTIDGWGYYVQNMSKALFSASASGIYGSSISYFKISGGYTATVNGSSLSYTTGYLTSSGTLSFNVVAVDSRGRSSAAYSLSNAIYVYPYSSPSFSSAVLQRGASPNTKNAVMQVKWTYSTVGGKNACNCTFKYKKRSDLNYTTYGSYISNNTVTTISNIFAETSSYDCLFVINDSLGNSANIVRSVSTTAATMDFKGGGKGIAIGKMSEDDDLFEVDWNAQFNENVDVSDCLYVGDTLNVSGSMSVSGSALIEELYVVDAASKQRTILDLIYPVGSIYLSVNSTSPVTIYGGSWTQLGDRFLLGASIPDADGNTTYTAGNTGGSAALQAHSHTFLTADNQNQTSGWTDNGRILRTGASYDITKSTSTAGAGDSGNMPPYLVVYMWKRTA